ncbi:MAG: phosphotransferase [Solirubrobacteraceae bacterium]
MTIKSSVEEIIELVPELARPQRIVSELPGGLTNVNHKVTTDLGSYVVRRWTDDSGLLSISRENEYENSRRAAEVGIGAPVVAYLPAQSAMVFGFLPGEVMTPHKLREGRYMQAAARSCARLHTARRFLSDFNMFELQASYLELVHTRGFRLPDRYEQFGPQVQAIRDALAVQDEGTVPCHNDLLAANLIAGGDHGFHLIDYEYSGNNDPCFELGNLWSESGLSVAQLEELVTAYYGRPLRHKVARARLWGLISKYGWMLWASIQDGASELEFDFWSWGLEKYDRAVLEFDSPAFEHWLSEARRPD